MRLRIGYWVLGCLMAFPAAGAVMREYSARITEAAWIAAEDNGACQLYHPIPDYGQAMFIRRGDGELAFLLQVSRGPAKPVIATLRAEPPSWRSDLAGLELDRITMTQGRTPVEVSGEAAERILHALESGLAPTFYYQESPLAAIQVVVAISSVNFMPALEGFLACRPQRHNVVAAPVQTQPGIRPSGLLLRQPLDGAGPGGVKGLAPRVGKPLGEPARQVARVDRDTGRDNGADQRKVIYFPGNGESLDDQARDHLNDLLYYFKVQGDIRAIEITGFADTNGMSPEAIRRSLARAKAVREYFISKGVPAAKLTTRFTGEYLPEDADQPVGSNRNHRVSINLVR